MSGESTPLLTAHRGLSHGKRKVLSLGDLAIPVAVKRTEPTVEHLVREHICRRASRIVTHLFGAHEPREFVKVEPAVQVEVGVVKIHCIAPNA